MRACDFYMNDTKCDENEDLIKLVDDAVVVVADLLTRFGCLQPCLLVDLMKTFAMLPQSVEENAIFFAGIYRILSILVLLFAVSADLRCFVVRGSLSSRARRSVSAAVGRVGLHPVRKQGHVLAYALCGCGYLQGGRPTRLRHGFVGRDLPRRLLCAPP